MREKNKVSYQNQIHIFIPCRKHLQSFKTNGGKLKKELRLQGTHCLYTLIAFHTKKKRLSSQSRKSEKKLSIIPKPHAHLHSMQKTSAKFENNQWKTVRGVAPTRYPLSRHFDSISYQTKLLLDVQGQVTPK